MPFMTRAIVATSLFLVTAIPASSFETKPAGKVSTEARLLADVKYLADDALEGRGLGTAGLDKAADFIREEFENAGLDVTQVDGGAFQKFTVVTGTNLGENNSLKFVSAEGESIDITYDTDYRTCSFGKSGTFDSELVFAGYGIKSSDPKYNDFEDVDVKGKTVIIVRRTPAQAKRKGPFSGRKAGQYGSLRTKMKNAIDAGAAAILFVNDPHTVRRGKIQADARFKQAADRLKRAEDELAAAGDDKSKVEAAKEKVALAKNRHKTAENATKKPDHDDLMKFGYAGNANDSAVPIFHVRQSVLDKLLTASIGKTLQQLETDIDKDVTPVTTALTGWKARGSADLKRIDTEVKNVIGVIEGEGDLADETVVIGAHYDHVGMGVTGSLYRGDPAIHNGADDNASGTVSLIELARQVVASGEKPKRRLVFIAFTAEETGLVGSARYCSEPIFPLEDTVGMFNMDMVGRLTGNRLTIYGTGTATGWDKRVAELGLKYQFDLAMKPEGLGPSDHASFYRKKIPVLHFFTGVHPNYHRPSDDWNLVNIEGMSRIVDCVEEIVLATANEEQRPEYLEVKTRARINETASRPFLGVVPNLTSEATGLAVANVAKDGPAEKSGVEAGDIIIKFGDTAIESLNDLDAALRKQTAGKTIEVTVKRGDEEKKLNVKLAQP